MTVQHHTSRRGFAKLIFAAGAGIAAATTAPAAASPASSITLLIESHRRIFAALDNAVDRIDSGTDTSAEVEFANLAEAEAEARDAILRHPVTTLDQFRQKARYLLEGRGPLCADMEPEDVRQLLRSVAV